MILEILFTSSVLIAGIFILRRLSRGKTSMRLRYMLWLLAAARLLLPVSLGTSSFSVMNLLSGTFTESGWAGAPGGEYASGRQEEVSAGDIDQDFIGGADAGSEVSAAAMSNFAAEKAAEDMTTAGMAALNRKQGANAVADRRTGFTDAGSSLGVFAGFVWVLGFLAVGGYMLVLQIRFIRRLRKGRQAFPEDILSGEWRERLRRRGMKVYQVKGLPSPCLVGRCIYIGEQLPGGTQGLSHILAHEYCHRMQGDNFWAFLRCLLVALYWFDPLVWAAVFAARQDSELACDEAAVRLLGETQRFAYGRTLLDLLSDNCKGKEYLGISPMLEQGERSVRERIAMLAGQGSAKRGVFAAVLAAAFLICGCAFTGARQDGADSAKKAAGQVNGAEETISDGQKLQTVIERAAFEEALNYRGVMEGKDDSELALNRKLDIQAYYDYLRQPDPNAAENPLENGWYHLYDNDREAISLYGLYTEEYGFRGIKMRMMVGGDVNTWDIKWCPSYLNLDKDNICVLEREADGLARRLVWKILEESTSEVEIWRLYTGYQYDTGTIEIKELSQEEYLAWAGQHLSFAADQEAGQVTVTYDGDMVAGKLDISDYKEYEVEDVQINTDAVGFALDDNAYGGEVYDDYEGVVIFLAVGLKLKGSDEIWTAGLPPLAVQAVPDEDGNFHLQQPAIAESYQMNNLHQERRLAGLPKGQEAERPESDDLEKPLVNTETGHHDLEVAFVNPCPDYDRISNRYGEQIHPVTGEKRIHNGVDLAAPEGADILAAAGGTVYRTGFDAVNGNYVVIWHGDSGQMTYYTHCKTVDVSEGQRVETGEKIASVGKTGSATGSFLHFAASYGENWEEPVWSGRK